MEKFLTPEAIDLNNARKALLSSLGENTKLYFEKMRLWFQMKTSKEEFDLQVRQFMTDEQVLLHNKFLLCLFNKVRGLAIMPMSNSKKLSKPKTSNPNNPAQKGQSLEVKRKYLSDNSNFESADIYCDVLNQINSPVGDEPIGANRLSAQELLLPDHTFVLARLMLAAWENNMDGAEDNTAHIIIAATQIFLKDILTALFSRRSGYSLHNQSMIHNIGEPVYDMWKRNSGYISRYDKTQNPTTIEMNVGQIPAQKKNIVDVEHEVAFKMACANQVLNEALPPISLNELEQTLRVHKNLIRNHSIYATNIERLFSTIKHSSWEDEEAKKLIKRKEFVVLN